MFFYAERWIDQGLEKAIFLSLAEFIPYRQAGWSASPEINAAADRWRREERTPLPIHHAKEPHLPQAGLRRLF